MSDERDDVPGALREPHGLAVAHERHELPEDDLGLRRVRGADPERLHADLHRLHLTVMVRAPDVDEVLPAALDLVEVVGEVVEQVGGVAVRLHQHPVALVAELLGPQPGGAVLLVGDARRP